MPIFDYKCQDCKVTFEKRVKKYDDPIDCPRCHKQAEKMLGMSAFILKGEGFYGNGSFSKALDGPKIDKELLTLSDVELNRTLGLPDDCA